MTLTCTLTRNGSLLGNVDSDLTDNLKVLVSTAKPFERRNIDGSIKETPSLISARLVSVEFTASIAATKTNKDDNFFLEFAPETGSTDPSFSFTETRANLLAYADAVLSAAKSAPITPASFVKTLPAGAGRKVGKKVSGGIR